MNNKKINAIIIIPVVIIVSAILITVLTSCYFYTGEVWYETLDEALMHEADRDTESKRILSVKTLLCITRIDDVTIMTFVSQNDTLVRVSFVSNEDGLYCVSGYTEEVSLSSPSEFVVTGESNQFILFPYSTYNDTVYGWCYSNVTPSVNGLEPSIETYEFECQGTKWSLRLWHIDDIDNTDDVNATFGLK